MNIISKQRAAASGLNKYYTDKLCVRGHKSERYVISGMCCECSLERYSDKIYKNNDVRNKVLDMSKGRCWYCGTNINRKTLRIDHLKPKASNGDDDIKNYRPSCIFCNLSKNNLSLSQFRRRMAYKKEDRPNIPNNILTFLKGKGINIPEPERYIFWFEKNTLD